MYGISKSLVKFNLPLTIILIATSLLFSCDSEEIVYFNTRGDGDEESDGVGRKRGIPYDFSVRLTFHTGNRRGISLTNGLRTAAAIQHELAFSWVYTSKVLELDECVTFTLNKCPPKSYFYFGVTRNLPNDDNILDSFSIFGPWSWSMEINGVYQTLYKHGCHYRELRCNPHPPEVGNRYSITRTLGGLLRFAVNGCDLGVAFNNVLDKVHVALMLTSGMKVTLN